MKVLLTIAFLTISISSFAKTQYIKCHRYAENLSIEIQYKNGAISYLSVEFWGPNLVDGLYRGQSLGADTQSGYLYQKRNKSVALVGSSVNPASDAPYLVNITIPYPLLGKQFKLNEISSGPILEYIEGYGNYYYPDKHPHQLKDFREMKNEYGLSSSFRFSKRCFSYIR